MGTDNDTRMKYHNESVNSAKSPSEVSPESKKPSGSTDQIKPTQAGVYIGGQLQTGGGIFLGRDQSSARPTTEPARPFAQLYTDLRHLSEIPPERVDEVENVIRDIEAEVSKGTQADLEIVRRYLTYLSQLRIPRLMDALVLELLNPHANFAPEVTRLAWRMKGRIE